MEDYSDAEHVADWLEFGRHVSDVDYFRRHVAGSSTPDVQILGLVSPDREPEVCYNAVTVAVASEQDVLWLEVPVHDAFGVHVLQPLEKPPHEPYYLRALKLMLDFDQVVELPSFEQLDAQIHRRFGLKHLV